MAAPDPVYLDHNATTPLLPEVVDAMLPFLREHHGNPSSGHVYGRRARAAVDAARAAVALVLGAYDDEIVFTSGGTEANNLAIRGVAALRPGALVTSTIEHPATSAPLAWLEQQGRAVRRVGVDADGCARLEELERALRTGPTDAPALLTLMHANNETGMLQPLAAAAALARAAGALVHTDAAQSVGKVPVTTAGVDLLSLVGHKLGAPKGVGALYVRRGTPLVPLVLGAGHERGLRPGTENVASIVGFGTACALVARDVAAFSARVRRQRDRLLGIITDGIEGVVVNGRLERCLPNTLNVRFPGVSGPALLAEVAGEVAASTGSACHDGLDAASAVILAMGVSGSEAIGTVRLTLGRSTTDDDVERAGRALVAGWRALTSRS